MARSPSDADDEFGVSLLMFRHGWSRLTLATRAGAVACDVSAAFGDVLETTIDLCHGLIDGTACEAEFRDEPGGHVWTLTPIAARRHTMRLRVYELLPPRVDADDDRSKRSPLVELVVKRRHLAAMLIGELWTIAALSREPSFRRGRYGGRLWHRNGFPDERCRHLLQRWEDWMADWDPDPFTPPSAPRLRPPRVATTPPSRPSRR